MKLSAAVLCALVGAASSKSIHDLKKSVMHKHGHKTGESEISGIFDYGLSGKDTEDVNQLAIKIATKGQSVNLSKEDQTAKWYPLKDSPLKDKGYESWAASANGFVFKPKEEKMDELALFQCESNYGVHLKDEDASLMHYSCGSFDPNSLQRSSGKPDGDGDGDGKDGDKDGEDGEANPNPNPNPNPGEGDGKDGEGDGKDGSSMLEVSQVMQQLTPQLRAFVQGGMPSFWISTPDGHVPYGWRGSWGDFDYPYYAVTDTGCYGCSMTDYVQPEYVDKYTNPLTGTSGYCKNSQYYPYMGFNKNDILPYSVYYTSGCGTNWAGSVIPGGTTTLQPNPFAEHDIQSTTNSQELPKEKK